MKFVILSNARSGTSLLVSSLNAHPDVLCHGEIFHRRPRNHLKGGLAELDADEIARLRATPQELVSRAFSAAPAARAVGFKMWRIQNEEICTQLLDDESIGKIILERKNKLALFSSKFLARHTGVWNLASHRKRTAPVQAEPLRFDAKQLRKFVAQQSALFTFYRSHARGPVLDLTYRDLVTDGFAPPLDFLGVAQQDLTPGKQQLHSSDILSRFAEPDHPEIIRALEKLDHPEWITE